MDFLKDFLPSPKEFPKQSEKDFRNETLLEKFLNISVGIPEGNFNMNS